MKRYLLILETPPGESYKEIYLERDIDTDSAAIDEAVRIADEKETSIFKLVKVVETYLIGRDNDPLNRREGRA